MCAPDQLTPHFNRQEFVCCCEGRYCDGFPAEMNSDLLARLEAVRHQLHESLDRKRSRRHNHVLGAVDQAEQDSEITPWPQADSFLGTLDSRRSELEKV